MSELVTADGVSVWLGGRLVLDRATLSLSSGEVVALCGPNGAGKSTLLRAMAGLIPIGAGALRLDGRPFETLSRLAIAQIVAYLPQAREIHWPMSARAIVGLGRLPRHAAGASSRQDDARAIDAAISVMTLGGIADRPVLALSGGEQARVLMARALAQEARVLIADEPIAGLDARHQLDLMAALQRHARSGGGVVVALHDLGLAARFADRIVLMAGGQIVASGPSEAVLTEQRLGEVFGAPLAVARIDGVPVVFAR